MFDTMGEVLLQLFGPLRGLRLFFHIEQYTTPNSQYKLQSGHCLLEEVLQKLEDLGIAHVGDQLLRLIAERIDFLCLIQVLQEKLLVRVIFELLNQLF